MKAYADTSFLVSLYTLDANSPRAAARMAQVTSVLFTPFGEIELTNAIEQRLYRKEIIRHEAQQAYAALQGDIQHGWLNLTAVPVAVYAKARQLSLDHTARLGTRALDVLHVAAALVLNATDFLTFDIKQANLARAEGLRIH